VPVCFVVMNNGEYGTLKGTLDRQKSRSTEVGRYVGLDLRDPALDWAGAGRFFGVPTVRVSDCDELAATVASVPSLIGPLLVEVPVTGHAGAGGSGATTKS
jgi:benzoylformate decarboxylase